MKLLVMRETFCPHCQKPTRHLGPILEEIFQRLPESARASRQIPYACPSCNRLGLADVAKEAKVFEVPNETRHPDDAIEFLMMLQCDEDNCHIQIPVFAPMQRDTTPDQATARMNEWKHYPLECSKEHPLKRPYFLVGMKQF